MKRMLSISIALLISAAPLLTLLTLLPDAPVEAAEEEGPISPPDDLVVSDPFSLNQYDYFSDDLVWHSNGNHYRFRAEEYNHDEIEGRFDTMLRMFTLDEDGDIAKDEHFPLPSFSDDVEYISDFTEYFFEADSGDIYGMVVMRTGEPSTYYGLDPDQYIQVHLIYDNEKKNFDIESRFIMEIEDVSERLLVHMSIGNKHFSTFHFCNGWSIIPYDSADPLNETFHVPDLGGGILPFYSMVVENEIAVVYQGLQGTLNITFLDADLNLTRSYEIDAYPEGIGFDNKLYALYDGSYIHVIIYRDELSPPNWVSGYSSLDHFKISTNGALLGSKKNVLDHPEIIWYDFTPILFRGNIYMLYPSLNGMFRFDGSMELLYFYQFENDNSWGSFRNGLKLIPFDGQHLILGRSYYYSSGFGIMVHSSDEFPRMGPYTFIKDRVVKGEVLRNLETINIEEGVNVVMEDTSLVFDPKFDTYYSKIVNNGHLTLKNFNCTNERRLYIKNHGTLVLEDVNIYGGLEGKGNLTFIGNSNIFEDPDHDYQTRANITFRDIVQTGSVDQDADFYWALRYLYSHGKFNVFFDNCQIKSKQSIIPEAVSSATFSNCTFEDIYGWGERTSLTFLNCEFKNVSEIKMGDKSSCTFTGCIFEDCHDLFYGSPRSVDLIYCTFVRTPYLAVEMTATWFNITNCEFSSGRGFFRGELISDLFMRGSTFENCTEIFIFEDFSRMDVQDCSFIHCNRTLGVDPEYSEPLLFNFKNNRFIGPGLTAYIIDDMLKEEHLFTYGHPKETISDDHIRMFDLRGNYWDSSDPAIVASRLTFGFLFLPYRTLDGTLITTDDNDADGMDDEWEEENGLDPEYYFDRFRDNDLDGYSNYEEFKEGMDPMDDSSSPTANLVMRRVVPMIVVASLLFSTILVLVFPLNSGVRNIRSFKEEKFPIGREGPMEESARMEDRKTPTMLVHPRFKGVGPK